jgi:hypothetical protein
MHATEVLMTPAHTEQSDRDLGEVVSHAEAEAQRLLQTAGTAPLDAVVWLSAHIAAVDHAVYPVVRRTLPDGRQVVTEHREIAARLSHTLRAAERHHSGDGLATEMSPDRLASELRSLVTEHRTAETALLVRLSDALSDDAQSALIESYESALGHGPTRPHPHMHGGGLIFWLDSLRDRILDTMDGRHVPMPKVTKEHVTPGRWGAYLLGQPHDQAHRDA